MGCKMRSSKYYKESCAILGMGRRGQVTVLSLVTDEPSECTYSNENCGFILGVRMTMEGLGLAHTIKFKKDLTYNVKCREASGNSGAFLKIFGG
jgi:hypothetical protein